MNNVIHNEMIPFRQLMPVDDIAAVIQAEVVNTGGTFTTVEVDGGVMYVWESKLSTRTEFRDSNGWPLYSRKQYDGVRMAMEGDIKNSSTLEAFLEVMDGVKRSLDNLAMRRAGVVG